MTTEFFKDFDENPFHVLDDDGILMKFFEDFDQNPFHVLDDHGILMKFFEDFEQNPGSQPLYPTIQMTIK